MINAIVSDADGTLVDTVSLIRQGQYEAIHRYLMDVGVAHELLPAKKTFLGALHSNIGGSAYDTLRRTVMSLYESTPGIIERVDYDALHEMLNPIQDELAPSYVKAYPHLSELLHSIADAGIGFGVLTSGTRHHIVRNFGVALPELGLEHLYLDTSKTDKEKLDEFTDAFRRHFGLPGATFVTCEDVVVHKPEPDGARYARAALGVKATQTAMIGDHAVDMQCAENDGIPVRIGVTHGFHQKADLEKAGATWVISSLLELKRDIEAGASHLR
jgi:phosphoglycolate phosphatase-like HAD superfamily hydrolase